MPRKSSNTEKICGNCRYHNTYEYPDTVFCFAKFANKKKPAFSIFSSCDEWEIKVQDCFCLEDASKKRRKKTK